MRMTSLAFGACSPFRNLTLTIVMAALCAAIICPAPANAAGYMYAGKRKTINCGIVVLGPKDGASAKQPLGSSYDTDATKRGVGDLFNLLDYRADLKPGGWSFDNPYAPVDAEGRKFTKEDPRFWQINLDTARNLSRMHVLYLPAEGSVMLSDENREKLRRFVDAGGVLWVDNVSSTNPLLFRAIGSSVTDTGTFFIPQFYFYGANMGFDEPWSRHHPLLSLPYWLDEREIAMLGATWGASACRPGYDPKGTPGVPVDPPIVSDVLFPIVAKNGGADASVAANAYGSGRVVATANFVGGGCFLPYPYSQPSLKFAYNVVAWASSWTDLRKDPRRSGRSIDTVGGSSLLKLWSMPGTAPSGESGAVIYKNVGFYSSGSKLYALDVNPTEDLDHNGNPDDGIQDMGAPVNTGQDLVWVAECDGTLSAPTVVTCQDPKNANKTVEAVLVMSSAGTVYMFEAFPNVNGILQDKTTEIVPRLKTAPTDKPYPPIYSNGWIYAAAGDGRMYASNPALLLWKAAHPTEGDVPSDWTVPDTAITTNTTLKAGANFGFVTASNSGAVVGMLYWCVSAPNTGDNSIQQEQNDYLYGVPVYVKNDRLKLRTTNSTRTLTEYQSSFPDLRMTTTYPAPVVRVMRNVPGVGVVAVPGLTVTNVYANSGLVSDSVVPGRWGSLVIDTNMEVPVDAVVYADYSVDYSKTGGIVVAPMPRIRAPLQPSSISNGSGNGGNSVPKTEVAATPALGADNVIFLNGKRDASATGSGAGGSVYAIKNDGSAGQSTKWNYMLHSGVPGQALQGVTQAALPIPGLLRRKPLSVDELGAVAIQSPQPTSSPVAWGDKVFVTVSGQDGGGALLCLKANSDFVIRIMENSGVDENGKPIKRPKKLWDNATNRPLQVKLWQPNLLCSSGAPMLGLEAVPVPNYMIDRNRGTISFSSFDRLKLRGGVGVLQETNTFSPSLPVWVLLDEVELPIDWTTWGPTMALADQLPGTITAPQTDCVDLTSWNNLLWYYAPPGCKGIHSSPVLIGNTVYFVTDEGVLYAVDADTGETRGAPMDAEVADPNDPSQPDPNWKPDPKFVLWREEIENGPVAMPRDTNVSASGSNGVLLVPGPNGLCAYANPATLVADSNRLVEVDSSGAVSWSLDSVMLPVNIPPLGNPTRGQAALPRRKVAINRPARARYTETGEILLVNSGSNMVCKTDKSGNIGIQMIKLSSGAPGWIRMAYDKFADPKGLLRPGQPGDLSSPADAISWQENEAGANGQTAVLHCLIADSGNSRVLDLVYRFDNLGQLLNSARDEETGYYLPELNWVSNTESKAEKYMFECLQVVKRSPADWQDVDIWAAVSNYKTSAATPHPQGLGGAIVALKYRTWDAASGTWNYSASDTGTIKFGCEHVSINGSDQPLACPRYFQVIDKPEGRSILLCDNRGVYKINVMSSGGTPFVVAQSLFDQAYREALDRDSLFAGIDAARFPLMAGSAQELPNGKWLIANSYSGSSKDGAASFQGEIFEFDPRSSTVEWCSPKLSPVRDPNPPYTITNWNQEMGSSYNLQQPRSAFRQF